MDELVRHQYISSPMVRRLTWEGHEFLDSIRDLKRFNEAKEEAIKLTGSAGFEVLKTILGELTKIGIRAVFPG